MRYDDFDFLVLLNKAQLVSLQEEQLLNLESVRRIAEATRILVDESTSADLRSSDYLSFEKRLIEKMGDEASNLHMGEAAMILEPVGNGCGCDKNL